MGHFSRECPKGSGDGRQGNRGQPAGTPSTRAISNEVHGDRVGENQTNVGGNQGVRFNLETDTREPNRGYRGQRNFKAKIKEMVDTEDGVGIWQVVGGVVVQRYLEK